MEQTQSASASGSASGANSPICRLQLGNPHAISSTRKIPSQIALFSKKSPAYRKSMHISNFTSTFHKFGDFHMSLHAIHSGQTISTVLAQVDHGSQFDILIWDETSKTDHTQT